MSKMDRIMRGNATVVVHVDGGWALPGGGHTLDFEEANRVACLLDAMLGAKHPTKTSVTVKRSRELPRQLSDTSSRRKAPRTL